MTNSVAKPSVTLLYHFFYPDDVVSARHFSQFAEELTRRGWRVQVLTSNRFCRYPRRKISPKEEEWQGIRIKRVWRAPWDQARSLARFANTFWMLAGWTIQLLRLPKSDVLIMGTDPPFSILILLVLQFFKRKTLFVHWCYDLYPEAIFADGFKGMVGWIAAGLKVLVKQAYHSLDVMVDIGSCMRRRLEAYGYHAHSQTLVPWALAEPTLEELRRAQNGSRHVEGASTLTLLYSGNIGKAHDFEVFLELAHSLYEKSDKIHLVFSCRGNRLQEFLNALSSCPPNVKSIPFADEEDLQGRLLSADIHLVSLRKGWEGIVVPSKFFGSLAVGKPVIYAGPMDSAIASWIRQYDVGFVLSGETIPKLVQDLLDLEKNPERLHKLGQNAYNAYHQFFSKKRVMDQWDELLRAELLKSYGETE
ncbi:MAG: glycosyltransferase family 4 protein [Chlamydiae bacterium]|nr:glycosyltransferase family 4 protein [Chlamydiota bacterium]MBI3266806.1 glycosyltransferase family 4 protein [Chlamydiota bacterium]